MSCPSRCDTSAKALVDDSQLCSLSSCDLASSLLAPMIGMTPGRTGTRAGSRPYLIARCFNPSYAALADDVSPLTTEKTRSAVRADRSCPGGEPPAFTTSGKPCGLRSMLSGPLTE